MKPTRTYDSLGKGRHAMSSPTDPHKQQETDFIASVCDVLDAHVDEFEHLVVVAHP